MTQISTKLVQQLRQKTSVGIMDCKKALQENNSDLIKAEEWLRKKGLAKAVAIANRLSTEGLVESYIHNGSRVGVLIEVNCETDFVARNEKFQTLVRDIAMQIAAYQNIEYVKVADIPLEVVTKEKEIEMGRDDIANKPEAVKEKIVQGRIEKRLKEMSLMDQPFLLDSSNTVEDVIKQHIALLGENIQVRRFVRFVLGEDIKTAG
ncbi:translation elongation factor Ts [Scytonema sp. UIC 10036]|uniref:translation elongation factor Ts n=1 Tax=Scytonema sp. UIC 10036 TaxID=2304196 RepID=UPI0012DA72C0|nr:translation elongation factor Ts [Scytonema sp. UIC 10036]MUG94547.1 translation elongation factor Ts [Scytonema sp. UIC 10036]